MFTRLKEGLLAAARGPHALRALAGVSFIESSVFPIPPDIMLVPMVLADRRRAFVIAGVCTLASVLGGLAGFAIGYFAWQILGLPLLSVFFGLDDVVARFAELEARIEGFGFWPQFLGVFGAGLTPFPYKIITIASGALNVGLPAFVIASVLSRGMRFFAEAALIYLIGERARSVIERRFGLILSAFYLVVVASYVALLMLS
jgi:membrane protein YqaA with SNARE-associated domain